MAANNSKSTNYWLGGFWTGGTTRGLIWRRGVWSGGEWLKGQWYSNTLKIEWNNNDPYKNKWSIWETGIWKSNSVEEYSFDDFNLSGEYSVWHGGIWKSIIHDGSTYTWQGKDVLQRINIYGNIELYDCDNIPTQTTKRRMLLPNANSLFLGGQWLRGEWHGGIFANSVWHSLVPYEVKVSYLDEVFFLYEHEEYDIFQNTDSEYVEIYGDYSILGFDITGDVVPTNDTFILYSTYFKTGLSYYDDLNYDIKTSIFTSGAFVNSIWEGGTVLDTGDNDPYNVMFGMSLSKSNNVVYDDGGIQPKNKLGVYESVNLLYKRYYGLNLPNWDEYLTTTDVYKILKIGKEVDPQTGNTTDKYMLPTFLEDAHMYSSIWKRGDFQHGVFNYSQFYDYTIKNVVNSEYTQDPNINNLNDDTRFDNYDSLFRKGLIYKSIFYGGTYLAQYNADYESIKSVFNRSIWATGYWVAATEYDYGQLSELPTSLYTDGEYITNAKFWKSVWLNGIWEGGNMALSAWNCVNPFNHTITLNNETFMPSVEYPDLSDFIFNNIKKNPLGKIANLSYYDENNNNELFTEYQNVIADLNRTDFLNIINSDSLPHFDMVQNKKYTYLHYFHEDEYIDPTNPEQGLSYYIPYDNGTPFGFVLSDSDYTTNPELVEPNFNNAPIECAAAGLHNCPSWTQYVQYGAIMLLDSDSYLNDDVLNENIFRTLGLVHNLLSVWQNGVFEGGIWNGGLWLKGEFMPYTYERYPSNVFDHTGVSAMYDYFDDNIINIINKYDTAIWSRGVFYAGYFHAKSLFFAVPAYVSDSGLYQIEVNLNYKFCLNDNILESHFNDINTNILQLKPLNLVSFFTRKASRGGNYEYKLFSVMNGNFMSGYFQDRMQFDVKDVPVIGTTAFPEDINEGNGVNKLTFGQYRITSVYDGTNILRGTIVADDLTTVPVKNVAGGVEIDVQVGEPILYDINNNVYSSDIITGINAWNETVTTKFFYEYHSSVGVMPIHRTNIKHAIPLVNPPSNDPSKQPDWSDIEVLQSLSAPVPSYAQGAGFRPEPYYPLDGSETQ